MPVTAAQVAALLAALKALVDEIVPLREQVRTLTADLAQVQCDYDAKLKELGEKTAELEVRRDALRVRLDPRRKPPPPRHPPLPEVKPPQAVDTSTVRLGQPPPLPPPPDPRQRLKAALRDHIYSFLGDSQPAVMEAFNAMVRDGQLDMADMLETLPWGPIWTERADWGETLEGHYDRLEGWQEALAVRVVYWQQELHRLEADDRYALLLERRARSNDAWQAYLDGMARDQAARNRYLQDEIDVLENAWRERQTANEGSHG
jgi:hypothetical protein